jgi:hypothetical protein
MDPGLGIGNRGWASSKGKLCRENLPGSADVLTYFDLKGTVFQE